VQNLVTTYDTRFRVDVEQFAAAHAARVADVRAPLSLMPCCACTCAALLQRWRCVAPIALPRGLSIASAAALTRVGVCFLACRALPAASQPQQYEPDIFPAAIYSMRSPALRAIVCASGKVVLTGAKARSHRTQTTCTRALLVCAFACLRVVGLSLTADGRLCCVWSRRARRRARMWSARGASCCRCCASAERRPRARWSRSRAERRACAAARRRHATYDGSA
jgi:hypothetical protein